MQSDYTAIIQSPVGRLAIETSDSGLKTLDYVSDDTPLCAPHDDLSFDVCRQLEQYFKTPRWKFELPLDIRGTPFQMRVWRALSDMHYGQTLTYGELASKLNTGARAIGNACRNNPVPIIIPCHRIISASGIGGYSGATDGKKLSLKISLIEYEAAASASQAA